MGILIDVVGGIHFRNKVYSHTVLAHAHTIMLCTHTHDYIFNIHMHICSKHIYTHTHHHIFNIHMHILVLMPACHIGVLSSWVGTCQQ